MVFAGRYLAPVVEVRAAVALRMRPARMVNHPVAAHYPG